MTTSNPAPNEAASPAVARGWRVTSRTVFYAVLLVLAVIYTAMAFDLAWSTTSGGRIGPGFFPRIIGILSLALLLWAVLDSLRPSVTADEVSIEDEAGEGDLGRHTRPLVVAVALCAGFAIIFLSLGAIIGGALFTFGLLALLNPGKWVFNAIVAVTMPLLMYLLLQSALNAGLPPGILPAF